jgi:hypothetical protein
MDAKRTEGRNEFIVVGSHRSQGRAGAQEKDALRIGLNAPLIVEDVPESFCYWHPLIDGAPHPFVKKPG